jgi:hypothetical protein
MAKRAPKQAEGAAVERIWGGGTWFSPDRTPDDFLGAFSIGKFCKSKIAVAVRREVESNWIFRYHIG